jgi:hypothetical protein
MDVDDVKKIEEIFQRNIEAMSDKLQQTVGHQMGVLSEDFQHKLDIVIEGQQMLSEKVDRLDGRVDSLEGRLDSLEGKLDAVAADLSAHRADTEAHHGVYRLRESGE